MVIDDVSKKRKNRRRTSGGGLIAHGDVGISDEAFAAYMYNMAY